MQWVNLSEVPPGSQFRFGGRLFRKLGMNLAEEPDGSRVVFPSSTEVEMIGSGGGSVRLKKTRLPEKPNNRHTSSSPKRDSG
jgi:hypothetical protein